jgi:hypothetical protein
MEVSMLNDGLGELLHPRFCRVSVSSDKTQIVLTFQSPERTPLTIALPLIGAAELLHKVGASLHVLGVRAKPAHDTAATDAVSLTG